MAKITQTGRRRLYPMPVEALLDHPLALAMPAAAFGGLARLVLHYWQIECRPLPEADHELMHIARAHAPTWRRHKADIMTVFEAVRPALDASHSHQESKRDGLIKGAQIANAKRRLKALRNDNPLPVAPPMPKLANRSGIEPIPLKPPSRPRFTDRR